MPSRQWTPDEERFLRQNYEDMTNTDLSEKLDVSRKLIAQKLTSLALERTKTPSSGSSSKKVEKVDAGKVHENVQCRRCLMVDGYTSSEKTCRYCGSKLFKGDVL